jgi:hypothetical protein
MKITETKTFSLTPKLKNAVRITFINRRGGTDCTLFTRHFNSEVKTKGQPYFSGNTQKNYTIESEKTETYHSTWLTEPEYTWLQDLMVSPDVTINGKPVRVLDSSYKYDSVDRLWVVELIVQNIYSQNKINL